MTSLLPTEKTAPSLSATTSSVLLFGPAKIGKSTLAADLDPDHTIFLATEPGLNAQEVFVVPIESWEHFREVGAELAKGEHEFTTVVIDTVDELYKLCADSVLKKLGVAHPSDLEYGKGWAAVTDEFRLRVPKLAGVGGLWFISHSKEVEIKQRVGTLTKIVPSLSGGAAKFLEQFCDFIFYVGSEQTADGDVRILRTQATENFGAGGRLTLPDPLLMPVTGPAGPLRDAMNDAASAIAGEAAATEDEAETKAEPAKPKPATRKPAGRSSRVGGRAKAAA